jgi:hypothetical protein
VTPNFRFLTRLAFPVALAATVSTAALAQQSSVVVDDDEITIRGCVGRAPITNATAQQVLVWTRSDLMLGNAMAVRNGQPSALNGGVFYWLDDDDSLTKHVGQMVEVKGDLGDFKKGEIDIERDGDFTKIELKLDGKKEKARVPTAWLGTPARDAEIDIVSRKVDVDKVTVLGACKS